LFSQKLTFEVSRQKFDTVYKYIQTQKEHHKKIGFQDEMPSAYKMSKLEIDERYI
jgi:REP-associated tyrosine transposase